MEQKITRELKRLGALYTAPVKVADISFSPDLRTLCEMNSCGAFGTNWGCPPGCGTVDELSCKVREYLSGVVYQYVGALEDSFDYEGMMEAGRVFGGITDGIRSFVQANVPASFVLGAGGCTLCGTCTYPDAPCRFPERKNISVEACGINVSVLCAKCGLDYIHGPNTVTNTGVVLFRVSRRSKTLKSPDDISSGLFLSVYLFFFAAMKYFQSFLFVRACRDQQNRSDPYARRI